MENIKVLAIMGSPRKGESFKVTQLFEQKLKAIRDVDFEYLFLKDVYLGNCKGCEVCIVKGEDKCPLQDDRAVIEDKMLAADGVIFVSPVYSQQVTALMKNFIDHMSYCWHRPRFFGQKAMAISTGGGQFKETLGYLRQNAKSWGFDFVHKLGVPHIDSLTPKFRAKSLNKIDRAAEIFSAAIKDKTVRSPGLGELIWFRMWKLNAVVCKDFNQADYAYWHKRGWLAADYYYNTKINPFKNMLAALAGKLVRIFMRKVYVGY